MIFIFNFKPEGRLAVHPSAFSIAHICFLPFRPLSNHPISLPLSLYKLEQSKNTERGRCGAAAAMPDAALTVVFE